MTHLYDSQITIQTMESYTAQITNRRAQRGRHLEFHQDENENIMFYQHWPKEAADYAIKNKTLIGYTSTEPGCEQKFDLTFGSWFTPSFIWKTQRFHRLTTMNESFHHKTNYSLIAFHLPKKVLLNMLEKSWNKKTFAAKHGETDKSKGHAMVDAQEILYKWHVDRDLIGNRLNRYIFQIRFKCGALEKFYEELVDITDKTEAYRSARNLAGKWNFEKPNSKSVAHENFDFLSKEFAALEVPAERNLDLDKETEAVVREKTEMVSSNSMVLILSGAFNPMTLRHYNFMENLVSRIEEQFSFKIQFKIFNIVLKAKMKFKKKVTIYDSWESIPETKEVNTSMIKSAHRLKIAQLLLNNYNQRTLPNSFGLFETKSSSSSDYNVGLSIIRKQKQSDWLIGAVIDFTSENDREKIVSQVQKVWRSRLADDRYYRFFVVNDNDVCRLVDDLFEKDERDGHVKNDNFQVVFSDLACGGSEMEALDEMMEFFRGKQNTSETEVSVSNYFTEEVLDYLNFYKEHIFE